jgi:hypothetical protein
VDDDLFAALIRHRATKSRWEAAWHLRGDIRVAGDVPIVFTNNRLVPGSMGFSEVAGPRAAMTSMWRSYVGRLMGRPTIRADCAILLRDFEDHNYWHLLHDLLPRLAMAEALDLDPTIPVVVSPSFIGAHGERLSCTPFLRGRMVCSAA